MASKVVLRCNAQYVTRWFFNKKQLPHNAKLSHRRTILLISDIDKGNEGLYECKGWNSAHGGLFYAVSEVSVQGVRQSM